MCVLCVCVCVCVFVSVCVCVCVRVCVCVCGGGRDGATYVHDANKVKKHESQMQNIRFQMQCNDIVILANKQEVKSNYRVWNLFQK